MSIRLIAKGLYRLEKEVERLEKLLEEGPREKRSVLKEELRKMTAERNRMRHILEGSKEEPPCRKPL
ncbi:MAG: hypothetical protein WAL98_00250 [Desulfatiglandaceae bacterium]|jgi:hypothetical protein